MSFRFKNVQMDLICECVLIIAVAATLAYTFLLAFNASNEQPALWMFAVATPLVMVPALCIASSGHARRLGGYAFAVVVAVVALGAASVLSGQQGLLSDEPGNSVLCLFVSIATTVAVCVCARRRITTFILFFGGVLGSCYIELLYQEHHWVVYVLTCCLLLALVLEKALCPQHDSKARGAYVAVLGETLAFSVLAVGVGALLFAVIVAPLQPPVIHPILSTEHVTMDDELVRGVGDEVQVVDPNEQSNTFTDTTIKSSRLGESSAESAQNMEQTNEGDGEATPQSSGSVSLNAWGQSALEAVSSMQVPNWTWPLALAVVFLAAAACVCGKLLLRRRRLARIAALPLRDQACELQRYFDKRLKRFGIARPAQLTPMEFAMGNGAIEPIEAGAEGAYLAVTRAACVSTYGAGCPSAADCEAGLRLAAVFSRNCRAAFGLAKYAKEFFFI